MEYQERLYFDPCNENSEGWRRKPKVVDIQYHDDLDSILETSIRKLKDLKESVDFILSRIGEAFASVFEEFPATEEIVLEGVYEKERKAIDELNRELERDMIANNIATAMRTRAFGQYVDDPAFNYA